MYRIQTAGRTGAGTATAVRLAAWLLAWPFRAAYLLFLAAVVWDTRRYLRECAADGLIESLSLQAFNAQIEADIARAAALRRVLSRLPC